MLKYVWSFLFGGGVENKRNVSGGDWVTCAECGYRAQMCEFLQADNEDTTCPECRSDIVEYEI